MGAGQWLGGWGRRAERAGAAVGLWQQEGVKQDVGVLCAPHVSHIHTRTYTYHLYHLFSSNQIAFSPRNACSLGHNSVE
jgi:hypothetical protein